MKFNVTGNKMTKDDFIDICKFLREKWKDREDILGVFVEEGTEDMSKEEAMDMVRSVFD